MVAMLFFAHLYLSDSQVQRTTGVPWEYDMFWLPRVQTERTRTNRSCGDDGKKHVELYGDNSGWSLENVF